MRSSFKAALMFVALAATLSPSSAAAGPQTTDAELQQQSIRRAQWHIDNDEPEFALRLLDGALEEDDSLWTAQFLRGMALGQLEDEKGALQAFLAADDLNPGVADIYFWAGIAAFGLGDYTTCWEQTIRAHQAGRNMSLEIEQLKEVADPPDDLKKRLRAPRAFVAEMDMPAREHDASLDTELMLGQGELLAVQRQLRQALRDSPGFGLVRVRELADYVIALNVNDYGDAVFAGSDGKVGDPPAEVVEAEMMPPSANPLTHLAGAVESYTHSLKGSLELVNTITGISAHSVPLSIEDITSIGDLSRELRRYVGYLERWVQENG
jgi:tetratricopeptide (TPR) repeat protein